MPREYSDSLDLSDKKVKNSEKSGYEIWSIGVVFYTMLANKSSNSSFFSNLWAVSFLASFKHFTQWNVKWNDRFHAILKSFEGKSTKIV